MKRLLLLSLAALLLAGCAMTRPWPLPRPAAPTPTPTAGPATSPATAWPEPVSPEATFAPVEPESTPAPATPAAPPTDTAPAPAATQPPATPIPLSREQTIAQATLRPAAWATLEAAGAEALARLAGMTHYSLTVTLAPDLSRVDGIAAIRYTNREDAALGEVYLHLYPNLWDGGMSVSEVQVGGRPVSATLASGDDLLRVPLDAALPAGQAVDLALRFAVPVPANGDVGNYGEFAYLDGILALAHFYPTVAVYESPGGWHLETPALQGDVLYHDASVYDVAFTAPAGLVVAATGATLDRADHADGTVTWQLAGGPMRDFNIAASAAYVPIRQQVGDITVTSYCRAAEAADGQRALEWAARSLEVYQAAFGPYPYRELDVAQTATRAGGIEYPGLIAVSAALYGDPGSASYLESVVVHEVAHQWWYNVVGNDQVNHPWLDEALAQYATYLYFREAYGREGAETFIRTMNGRWSRVDFGEKPIGLPVAAYDGREYGAIVYGRGPLFFLALRDHLGEAQMAGLLRRYYAAYAWGIAAPTDFRGLAEAVAEQDLGDLFGAWVGP